MNPQAVIVEMAEIVRQWGISRVTGDNYAAEFTAAAFESCGIRYRKAEKNKSQLYAELLPVMCAGEIELLDFKPLISQLAGLEPHRTRSGGKDVIDHSPGGHDDVANSVAGVARICAVQNT